MALLDQFGRTIDTKKLTREESAPSMMGVRTIMSGHPSRSLTPQRIAAILIEAEEGDATRYFELAEDMEEKDLHYLGVLGTRKRAVAQLEITIEAASDDATDVKIADEVREFLRRDTLQGELFDILDAIGKGVSCSEIVWETSAKQWRPAHIKWREPKFFQFDPYDGETLRLRDGIGVVDLTPYKYITHVAKAKSGLPIRGGLARAVSWVWLFKNFSLKNWVAFGEIFGQPYRVGKYHPSATVDDKAALLRAVASIGSDAAAIVPESMMIEFIEAEKSGSIDVYDRFSRFLDEQVSKGVLGQTLTTEVTQGGGNRALGQVHANVAQDIRDSDSQQLAATLNRDLVRPYVDLNHGPQKRYPVLIIGRPDELTLPQKLDYTEKFVRQGLKVESSQVRDRLGWTEPEGDAELLGASPGRTAPPPGARGEISEQSKRAAFDRIMRAVHAVHAVRSTNAVADVDPDTDAIDAAVAAALEDEGWQPTMEPMVAPLRELLAEVESLGELRERLAELVGNMNLEELTAQWGVGDAMFVTRLAGALGISLEEVDADV
ncbi:MAG: DUF935 domain-containing protein [Gemmatimonadaceae bacterium]